MKKIIQMILLFTILLNLVACTKQNDEIKKSGFQNEGISASDKTFEKNDNNISQQKDKNMANTYDFGVTVDEVVKNFNEMVADSPDSSQEAIDLFSLKNYSLENNQTDDGRKINIYTYFFKGNLGGVNVVEDANSHNAIYVDLFFDNNIIMTANESAMEAVLKQYYWLAISVDKSIDKPKFEDEIWGKLRQSSDYSTIYNNKKFFYYDDGEASYFAIMLKKDS